MTLSEQITRLLGTEDWLIVNAEPENGGHGLVSAENLDAFEVKGTSA